VKLVCAMLRDLKITLVMKMENAFVTLTLLETSVINVMLDLLNSQLVTSVLLNILEKIAKNVNVIQMALKATIAIQLTENVLAKNILLVTTVMPPNQDSLTFPIQNHVLVMRMVLLIIIVTSMENVLAKQMLLVITATNVLVDFLDSLLVERHVNVTMKVPQSTIVTRTACVHAKKTLLETNVTLVWKDTPISQTVTNVIMDTMALEVVDILMKDMIMNMM